MAKQNRTTLKGYFETGDIPNQTQYAHLIDSQLNLSDTNAQVAASEVSASALLSETFISASGDISTKGNLSSSGLIVGGLDGDNNYAYVSASHGSIYVSGTGSFGQIIVTEYKDINLKGDITASGNISASGYVSCSALVIAGSEIRGAAGDVTASGNIKAAGFVGPLTTTGITSTGPGVFTTLDTGQGANELYAMNQDVETTDAVTFASVNTGQGANELYAMNQSVRSTDIPEFAGLTLTSATNIGAFEAGSSITDNRRKNQFGKVDIPALEPGTYSEASRVFNSTCSSTSTVVCSSAQNISVEVISVTDGGYYFHLHNPGGSNSTATTAGTINCVLL